MTGERDEIDRDTPAWFDDLYGEHWSGMVRLAFVMVGDRAVAEELAQDAFTRMLRRGDEVRAPLPYLRSAVYNACRNHLRGLSRRRSVPTAASSEAPMGDHVIDAIRGCPCDNRRSSCCATTKDSPIRRSPTPRDGRSGPVKSGLHRALDTLRKELR